MLEVPLVVSQMDTTPLYDDCAFLKDWPGVPVGNEEGEIISAALGDKRAILLAHHGQLVTGATVEEACNLAVLIERAARLQLLAMSAGTVQPLPPELAREAHDWTSTARRDQANFAYYARRALRQPPRLPDERGADLMPTAPPLSGVIAYPVTPFSPTTGEPDLTALHHLTTELVDSGCHAVAPLGSTGESAYLQEHEWDAVCATTLQTVAGRVPTLVGVSHWSTETTVRRARVAAHNGATAIMVLAQTYWKLTQDELEQHFATVAAATDLPVMLYNNPGTSGVDLIPETVVRIARSIPNLTMVKESSGDVARFRAIREMSDGALSVYNGNNPVVLDAFRSGAAGWCTAAPCLVPQWCLDLYAAVRQGDDARADILLETLLPFLEFIVGQGLPRAIKAGLDLTGRPAGPPRPPLLPLPQTETEELRKLLERIGSAPV